MENATIIFGPDVDLAILNLIDHVDISEIPAVLEFIENVQRRLIGTLSTFPNAGAAFQGKLRMFVVDRYVFLYEYHADLNEVHVLDLQAPGRDWR